jgi:hypothetical protein
MGDTWYLDEVFVKIQGQQRYLWRAVDEDGDVIDIFVRRWCTVPGLSATESGSHRLTSPSSSCRWEPSQP